MTPGIWFGEEPPEEEVAAPETPDLMAALEESLRPDEVEMFDNSQTAEPGQAIFDVVDCGLCNLDSDSIPKGEQCENCALIGTGEPTDEEIADSVEHEAYVTERFGGDIINDSGHVKVDALATEEMRDAIADEPEEQQRRRRGFTITKVHRDEDGHWRARVTNGTTYEVIRNPVWGTIPDETGRWREVLPKVAEALQAKVRPIENAERKAREEAEAHATAAAKTAKTKKTTTKETQT